ncbi:MAG TPA: WYL domain-containing protein [Gammaproteobacteria bacterium]|nr:WYL domain-containing protein [Gammaproteobacteria bacterium]
MWVELAGISRPQQERLSHIDFRAWFIGQVGRSGLVARFGMGDAAATRDLALYRELAPQNLTYNAKTKIYTPAAGFKPIYQHKASQVLAALSQGFGEDFIGDSHPMLACETPAQLNSPELPILAILTRAIYQNKRVRIYYVSPESGSSRRDIAPFVLVDNGLRWHVRGFDRKRKAFIDFVINRISKAKLLDEEPEEHETREADIQWNRIVEMEVVPHPKIKHPEAIAMDYAMEDGVRKQNVRASQAGYVLRRWNVDCTEDHSLQGAEYQLWLRNRAALYGVENLVLVPGYNK